MDNDKEKGTKLEDCWAKTDRKTGLITQTIEEHHELSYEAILTFLKIEQKKNPQLVEKIPGDFPVLAALHDLGKYSPGFQGKIALVKNHLGLTDEEFEKLYPPNSCYSNHAYIGEQQFNYFFKTCDSIYGKIIGKHHGRRIRAVFGQNNINAKPFGGNIWSQMRNEVITRQMQRYGRIDNFETNFPPEIQYYMGGLIVLADFMASSIEGKILNMEDAKNTLRNKINSLFSSPKINLGMCFGDIFKDNNGNPFIENALQEMVEKLPLDNFNIILVEASMGMGKTETGYYLAYKFIELNPNLGINYFQPTIYTSNQAYNRTIKVLGNIVSDFNKVERHFSNYMLVHSKAHLFDGPRISDAKLSQEESDFIKFFSGNRKKTLAKFGVCTWDQFLLPSIGAKHSPLGTYAFSNKIIIMDEIHAMDDYQFELLCERLKILLSLGCKIILLSATLNNDRKKKIFGDIPESCERHYPLITTGAFKNGKIENIMTHKFQENRTNHYKIIKVHNHYEYFELFCKEVKRGKRVIVFCNSIKRAQYFYNEFKKRMLLDVELKNAEVGIMHSSIVERDKRKNEAEWVKKHEDKNSCKNGQILFSTQVAEQGINLDADVMFTDLCPIEQMLQRMGREHRRKKDYRSYSPEIYIFDPIGYVNPKSEKDIESSIEKCKPFHFNIKMYPKFLLYVTSVVLKDYNNIVVPNDIRKIINDVSSYLPVQDFEIKMKKDYCDAILTKRICARRAMKNALDEEDANAARPTTRLIEIKQYECLLVKEHNNSENGVLTIRTIYDEEIKIFDPNKHDNVFDKNRESILKLESNLLPATEYVLNEKKGFPYLTNILDLYPWAKSVIKNDYFIFEKNILSSTSFLTSNGTITNFKYDKFSGFFRHD